MAWRNVAVGVMKVNTYTAISSEVRTGLVRAGARALRDFRDQQAAAYRGSDGRWDQLDSRPSMVFVAPEYMLSKQGAQGTDDRFRTLAEKDEIEKEMREFSSAMGAGLVLAPGSLSYVEPVAAAKETPRQLEERLAMGTEATRLVFKEQAAAYLKPHLGQPTQAAARTIADAYLRSINPQAQAVAPDTMTSQEKRGLLTRGDAKFLAKNEMVLYHRGKDVGRYAKIADFNEVPRSLWTGSRCTVFIPGARIGRATVGGIPWGVEICFDHALGVLNNTAAAALPRVHLLCSAAAEPDQDHFFVQPGGYVVHSSTEKPWCGVWRRHPTRGIEVVPFLQSAGVSSGKAELYLNVIELDLP